MRLLHLFDHSAPLQSGYASRSLGILRTQRGLGWETRQLTTPRHNHTKIEREFAEGFWFDRTLPVRPGRPMAREFAEMRATARRLQQIANEWQPDAIHVHSPALNGIPAIWVGRRLALPVVYEVRAIWEDAAVSAGTYPEGGLRYRSAQWLEEQVLRRASGIVTICDGLKSDLGRRGIPEARIHVVPNSVDLARFQPTAAKDCALLHRLGLENSTVLGFIGSFYDYEGLDFLIRTLREIRAEHPAARLLLVGGGPEEAALRCLAEGDKDSVVFTGRVASGEVQKYYSLVDICVFPRQRMRLTEVVTPLKPLEAMAMQKPVLASDVGGHRELICHERTGLLFRAGDARSLTSAVLRLSSDPGLRDKLAREGREFVATHRSWEATVRNYIPLFRQLVEGV